MSSSITLNTSFESQVNICLAQGKDSSNAGVNETPQNDPTWDIDIKTHADNGTWTNFLRS